jgi:hypothetical protein
MPRLPGLLLFLALAFAAASACKSSDNQKPPPEGSAASGRGWRRFEKPEGRFSILLPHGEIRAESEVIMPEGPVPTISYAFVDEDKDEGRAYSIAYTVYPEAIWKAHRPDEIIDGARDNTVERMRGRLVLVAEKKVTLDGHPARELVFAGKDDFPSAGRLRMVMIDGYYYLLQADSFGKLRDVPDPEADRFFDSFRYLPK